MTTLMRVSRPHQHPMPPQHRAQHAMGTAPALTRSPSGSAIPCRDNDPELFFAETPAGVEAAKALCVSCPMQLRCLAEAIERREPCGVWGGELFADGAIVPRKRPRGRPRKHDAERDALWFAEHAGLVPSRIRVAAEPAEAVAVMRRIALSFPDKAGHLGSKGTGANGAGATTSTSTTFSGDHRVFAVQYRAGRLPPAGADPPG